MSIRLLILLTAAAVFLPSIVFCQNNERILFDTKDSTAGYYLAIRPQSKQIKGVLILLSSFLPPEGLLPETKLHNVAYANDLLTIIAPTKQKLYADSFAVDRINAIIKDVVARFSTDTSPFALAGYDEAGNIALRYTEFTYQYPEKFPLQPKAVFAIDAAVDLFGLWHWSENQVAKHYWEGSVGDAKYYIDNMTKENGTIYDHADRYKFLSPFYREGYAAGNEQYLKNVAVRLYYDIDIEWQLKNRRNSFYDTKAADGSELIKQLLLSGNNKAAFVASKQPGVKSNGQRHPNALSIVDEVDCIQWLKSSLHIFDANTWIPPYDLLIPAGWGVERFALPPEFAPQINFKGVEDVRFSPGWGEIKSEEHWCYSFLWWIDGTQKVDAAILQTYLKSYYTGLVGRNIISRNIPSSKIVSTVAAIKKIKTGSGDVETYRGTIAILDYHSQQPITLNCLIHVKDSKTNNHTAIYFEISPQPFTHPVWQKLNAMGDKLNIKN